MAKTEFDSNLPPEQRDSAWYEELFRRRWEALGELDDFGQAHYSRHLRLNQKAIVPKKLASATLYEAVTRFGNESQFEILIGEEKESDYRTNHSQVLDKLSLPYDPFRLNRAIIFSDQLDQPHLLIADFSKDALQLMRAKDSNQNYGVFVEEMIKTFFRYGIKSVIDGTSSGTGFGEVRVQTDIFQYDGFNADKIFEQITWFGIISESAKSHSWTITQYLRFIAFPNHWPGQEAEGHW